jgi:hypothetical protein
MVVMFFGVPVDNDVADACKIILDISSPTEPAAALSLVVVPITPDVEVKAMLVALAAPRTGVTNVGLVVKEIAPEPLTFTPNAVATPVPNPDIPVLAGKPVQFVRVPDVGVPKTGVVKEGEVVPAKEPVPDCPDKEVFTALFVAMFIPYATVNPADCGAEATSHSVFATVQIM